MPDRTATAAVPPRVAVVVGDGRTGPRAVRDRARAASQQALELRTRAAAVRTRMAKQRRAVRTRLSDLVADLQELRERLDSAERRADTLQEGLLSNRRIGMAVGILMCRDKLTEEQAFDLLRQHSQHRNTKVRDLAETVIYTGTL
jgi:hypothetical protein